MNKSDLKTGMVVEVKNGEKYLVMLNAENKSMSLINFNGGFMSLDDYDESLNCVNGDDVDEWSVIKVYSLEKNISVIFSCTNRVIKNAKVLWERREEPVEMTVAEIEKKLGIKNLKIVKE